MPPIRSDLSKCFSNKAPRSKCSACQQLTGNDVKGCDLCMSHFIYNTCQSCTEFEFPQIVVCPANRRCAHSYVASPYAPCCQPKQQHPPENIKRVSNELNWTCRKWVPVFGGYESYSRLWGGSLHNVACIHANLAGAPCGFFGNEGPAIQKLLQSKSHLIRRHRVFNGRQ